MPYAARWVADKPPKKGARTLRPAPLEGLFERAQMLMSAVAADLTAAKNILAPLKAEVDRMPHHRPAGRETSRTSARSKPSGVVSVILQIRLTHSATFAVILQSHKPTGLDENGPRNRPPTPSRNVKQAVSSPIRNRKPSTTFGPIPTNIAAPDPFVLTAAGRAWFRPEDLIPLGNAI